MSRLGGGIERVGREWGSGREKKKRDFVFLLGFFMESKIAGLTTNGGEEEAWQLNLEEDEFCFFGCLLTLECFSSVFQSILTTLTNIWHLLGNVFITDLVTYRLEDGEDHLQVSLYFVDFGLKVHDLPRGLMSQVMARQ
ncbi:hypothetical protein Gotri_019299 [Gossypium trilobum]|uniref:Uncharacterized protein n=1 Tax=Gossypium trilobum TaxID=34281 RepID=A0A7J9ECG0_9ROSI|nr:hypothetical protein [Gossypium trilobum]